MFLLRFRPMEENKGADSSNGVKPEEKKPDEKTVEEKKDAVKQKADIGKDEIARMSESTAHALLEETRALRADLASTGLFGKKDAKKPEDAAKPPEQKQPEKGFFDRLIDFDW